MSKKIKIGFLMQSGLEINRNSAPKIHFQAVIKVLKKHGHECKLLSLQPGRIIVEYNPETAKFENRPLGLSGSKWFTLIESGIRKIQTLLKLMYFGIFNGFRYYEACLTYLADCDIFYERYSVMALGGACAARKLNKPLILEMHADIVNAETPLHGYKLGRLQHFLAERITEYNFHRATKIIVVSNALKNRLENYWNVDSEKIEVVPNGVDTELFENASKKINSMEITESEKGTDKVILFMGSFLSWHGVDILIDSFQRVVKQYPNVRLLLIGEGLTKTISQEEVCLLDLQDRVEFTGDVEHDKIPYFLQKADICVAPYKKLSSELWFSPLKVFEYMYMEKAIVASDAGQISEIIQHGYSGLLVEPGDPEGLANAILELLLNPEKAKMMGKNAKERVLDGYTWKAHCGRIEQIMLESLDR